MRQRKQENVNVFIRIRAFLLHTEIGVNNQHLAAWKAYLTNMAEAGNTLLAVSFYVGLCANTSKLQSAGGCSKDASMEEKCVAQCRTCLNREDVG